MTTTAVSLAQAYGRVQPQLDRVEALLAEELRSDRPEVASLCRHLSCFRGKMLRPALLLLTARATGSVRPIHLGLAAVVEMFHLATLIHDDVLDEASIRRQAATINQGWGNEAAVILGDWLISHAYHLCSRQGDRWASLEISRVAHRVCEGELMQLFRRGDSGVSADQYLAIVADKAAALIGLAARLGARFNEASPPVEQACLDFGQRLGIAFQIIDDVLDLVGNEQEVGKTLGSDLAKGKVTLPIIHLLAAARPQDAQRVRSALGDASGRRRGTHPDPDALAEVRRLVVDYDCITSAEVVARGYIESAKARLADLPDGDARTDLQLLADFILTRSR